MTQYILRRLAQMIPITFGILTLVFSLIHLIPGDPAIQIAAYDGISDNGQEIYNFCKQEGIANIALMGVHTNICILNRAFGVREMTRLGFHVVVARDLTDAMYDPRKRPFVSHARGTELVVEHIETNWCPSILGEDLTRVIAAGAAASR